jgi:hypothetical protein
MYRAALIGSMRSPSMAQNPVGWSQMCAVMAITTLAVKGPGVVGEGSRSAPRAGAGAALDATAELGVGPSTVAGVRWATSHTIAPMAPPIAAHRRTVGTRAQRGTLFTTHQPRARIALRIPRTTQPSTAFVNEWRQFGSSQCVAGNARLHRGDLKPEECRPLHWRQSPPPKSNLGSSSSRVVKTLLPKLRQAEWGTAACLNRYALQR